MRLRLMGAFANNWVERVALLLRLLRRLSGVLTLDLTKRHEAVVFAMVLLSRSKPLLGIDEVAEMCQRLGRDERRLPLLDRGELGRALSDLERIRCVCREGTEWRLIEQVLIRTSVLE